MPKIYTIKELAKLLKTSKDNALKLVRGEQIKSFKVGREWRVTENAILKYIQEQEEKGQL